MNDKATLYTLGRFQVLLDGAPAPSGRKPQRRVLELLKVAVALGGAGIAKEAITAALWPDAEADAAADALEITLHRARRLLGRKDALVVARGAVALNPDCVWVDAAAFDRLAEAAESATGEALAGAATQALALYRGAFLRNEPDTPWLLPARDRLRSRFLRLVGRLGCHFEAAGEFERAADLYRRAIEAEPLAEEPYRGLMQCLLRLGRPAEAHDVYRRCRQMLAVVLGVSPSPVTDAIYASLARRAIGKSSVGSGGVAS
jgi:DNA-binding SARP family transcriptional activator